MSKLANLRRELLKLTQEEALTVDEMAAKTGAARSTTYHVVGQMLEAGELKASNPHAYRNKKYVAGNFIGRKVFIPILNYKKSSFKAIYFMNSDISVVVDHFTEFFGSLATVFKTAERLAKGTISHQEADLRLRAARVRALKARNDVEAYSNIIKQFLDNDNFWDVVVLEQFSKDPDWKPNITDQMLRKLGELPNFDHEDAVPTPEGKGE